MAHEVHRLFVFAPEVSSSTYAPEWVFHLKQSQIEQSITDINFFISLRIKLFLPKNA